MSEEATLDDFTTEERQEETEERPIETIPESSVESSLDETSVGEIPDDWKATRLEDIAEETEYGLTESAEPYDPDKPRYIRTQDFDDFGGLKHDSRASLSREKAKDGLLEKGDMLFARSGSVGASLGKTFLYEPDYGECCFGGYSIRHRLQKDGINLKYISQYTLSEQYWDWIRRRAKTTAQSNINTGEYGSLLLPIPPLNEQRKTATVLHNVDQAILRTKKIIGQTERIQKGVRQDVFSHGIDESGKLRTEGDQYQETYLGVIPDDWELRRVDTLCSHVIDCPHSTPEYTNNGILVVRTSEIEDGRFDPTEAPRVSEEGYQERISRLEPKPGDVIFTREAPIGEAFKIPEGMKLCLGQRLMQLRPKEGVLHPDFLVELLYSDIMQSWFERSARGSTSKHINVEDVERLKIPIPSLAEQHRIDSVLGAYREKLESEREYLNRLQRFKQGLMQDLLSGAVRTTDTNIEVPEEIAQHG